MFKNHILAAFLAVVIILVAGYLADSGIVKLAGLTTAIPISLVALFFAEDRNKPEIIDSFMKGMIIYFLCTVFLYFLVTYEAAHVNNAILIAIGTWFALVSLYFVR